jgi:ribonuclease HII
MPWIVGIDEAGYGPNLGPFVMTSVACRIPEELVGANLWKVLKKAVRRPGSANNGRLLIEDSKIVYSPPGGLLALETGVLAALFLPKLEELSTAGRFLEALCPSHSDLRSEPWYAGVRSVPVVADLADVQTAAARFVRVCQAQTVHFGLIRSVIICPRQFNALLDQWGSKGAVLGQALADLLQCNLCSENDGEPVSVLVDKHGGRNTYIAILQDALPQGFVLARGESMERSVYEVLGLQRPVTIVIQPRADAEQFCVALASMVSKYVRELLMCDFNEFWQEQMPGVIPTAGYPGDASRFYEAIRPAIARLGIPEPALWRRK